MYWMRVVVASTIGLLGFAATYYLLSRADPKALASAASADLIALSSLVVNVFLFIISIVSLYIALAAFNYARAAGADQQQSLDASRSALDAVVSTAGKQQQLLDENLKIAFAHFEVVKQQRDEELRRLQRKPRLEITVGNLTKEEISKLEAIRVAPNERSIIPIDFIVTNQGDVALLHPLILITADPSMVVVSQRGQSASADNPNWLQLGGLAFMDILPYEITQTGYSYKVDVVVPPDVQDFVLDFKIWGENLAVQSQLMKFFAVRKPGQPSQELPNK